VRVLMGVALALLAFPGAERREHDTAAGGR
jgi:hypothetical protein